MWCEHGRVLFVDDVGMAGCYLWMVWTWQGSVWMVWAWHGVWMV